MVRPAGSGQRAAASGQRARAIAGTAERGPQAADLLAPRLVAARAGGGLADPAQPAGDPAAGLLGQRAGQRVRGRGGVRRDQAGVRPGGAGERGSVREIGAVLPGQGGEPAEVGDVRAPGVGGGQAGAAPQAAAPRRVELGDPQRHAVRVGALVEPHRAAEALVEQRLLLGRQPARSPLRADRRVGREEALVAAVTVPGQPAQRRMGGAVGRPGPDQARRPQAQTGVGAPGAREHQVRVAAARPGQQRPQPAAAPEREHVQQRRGHPRTLERVAALLLAELVEAGGQVRGPGREHGVKARYERPRCVFEYFPLRTGAEPEAPNAEIDLTLVPAQYGRYLPRRPCASGSPANVHNSPEALSLTTCVAPLRARLLTWGAMQ